VENSFYPRRHFVGTYVLRILLEKGKSDKVDREDRVVKSYFRRWSSE